MTNLKRVLAWFSTYAAVAYVVALAMTVPPRLAAGYSLTHVFASAASSILSVFMISVLPAFLVLLLWAMILERRPDWEMRDPVLLGSSLVMALAVGAGVGLLSSNPGFSWRTGSYLGDAAQVGVMQAVVALLCLIVARLVVRSWMATDAAPGRPAHRIS